MTAGRTTKGWFVARLHYTADETLTQDRLDAIRADQPTEAHWRKEMDIEPYALQGQLVYPSFDERTHVLSDEQVVYADPANKVRRRGTCYMAIDPHPRTPHCAIWVMVDRWSDWYVYRDMWPSVVYGELKNVRDDEPENNYLIWQYAEAVAAMEGNAIEWREAETERESGRYIRKSGGELIYERYMDQAGKGFFGKGEEKSMWTAYYDFGIECSEPYKVHQPGEDKIRGLLQPRHHSVLGNWPRLHIAQSCRELITEFKRYRYKKTKRFNDEKELFQQGIESRTHGLDCLRYLATAEICYLGKREGTIYVRN